MLLPSKPAESGVALPTRDWVGMWFDVIERDAGEYVGIRFGDPSLAWSDLPHTQFDGIGGLAHLLRARGVTLAPGELPRLRESAPPRLRSLSWAFLRFMVRKPKRAARWLKADAAAPAPIPGAATARLVPTSVAGESLSPERTRKLEARAAAAGVSLNSWLLWSLVQVSESGVAPGPRLWMVPVNMRGAVSAGVDTSNHASFIEIPITTESARQVHEGVRARLQKHEHWAGWFAINLGRFIGREGLRRMYLNDRKRGRSWVGSFSNLGDWPQAGVAPWLFAPPVSAACPLGTGVVKCAGSLTATVQWHPGVSRDPAWAREFLVRWLAAAEG